MGTKVPNKDLIDGLLGLVVFFFNLAASKNKLNCQNISSTKNFHGDI